MERGGKSKDFKSDPIQKFEDCLQTLFMLNKYLKDKQKVTEIKRGPLVKEDIVDK